MKIETSKAWAVMSPREQYEDLVAQAQRIEQTASDADRRMTDAEQDSVDALMTAADAVGRQPMGRRSPVNSGSPLGSGNVFYIGDEGRYALDLTGSSGNAGAALDVLADCPLPVPWIDTETGRELPVFRNGDSMQLQAARTTSRVSPDCIAHLSAGRWLQSCITGRWDANGPEAEYRAAMSEGTAFAGGYLVPDEVSASIIDRARARSVLSRAGAGVVPMASETLTIAKIATDGSFETKTENAAFSGSDVTFGSVHFTARTIGNVFTASRELAEDAPNFAEQMEAALSAMLATEIDRLGLVGSGSQEPTGLLNLDDVDEQAAVGAIAWTDFMLGWEAVQTANYEPNALVYHPAAAEDLAVTLVNSESNNWASPPAPLVDLPKFVTTSVTSANAFIGDFTQFLIGLRRALTVEMTTSGDSAFSKHQLLMKPVWRGDVNATNGAAFSRLIGIT